MEGIMNFVAEWVCVLTSVWAREWQYKDILTEFDDQVWKELSEEWQKYLSEKEESPALRGRHCVQKGARLNAERLRLGTSGNLNEIPRQGWRGREVKWKMASWELRSSAQCQGRPRSTCEDPLTKRI